MSRYADIMSDNVLNNHFFKHAKSMSDVFADTVGAIDKSRKIADIKNKQNGGKGLPWSNLKYLRTIKEALLFNGVDVGDRLIKGLDFLGDLIEKGELNYNFTITDVHSPDPNGVISYCDKGCHMNGAAELFIDKLPEVGDRFLETEQNIEDHEFGKL